MRRLIVVFTAVTALAACQRTEPPVWYLIEIQDPPIAVPFLIALPVSDGDGQAEIANGSERLRAPAHRSGDRLVVEFPEFGNQLEIGLARGGGLSGRWLARGFIDASFEIVGVRVTGPDPALRFAAGVAPSVDVGGVWELTFDELGPGKARLRQTSDGVVDGTVIIGDLGDARFLSGRVSGRRLSLSTFDGIRAFRLDATVAEGGRSLVNGVARHLGWSQYAFHGQRGDPAMVQRARMRAGTTRMSLPELADERLAGKPVIVDFFGTWCPTCIDLTPVLIEAYRRHHAAGLEVVSVALEPYDREFGRERIEAFRARYRVPYPIHHRVVTGGDLIAALPPELEGVAGFPVTVFVDRDGSVRAVHTGFISPAAPEEHAAVMAEFDRLTKEIVASPAPAAP